MLDICKKIVSTIMMYQIFLFSKKTIFKTKIFNVKEKTIILVIGKYTVYIYFSMRMLEG